VHFFHVDAESGADDQLPGQPGLAGCGRVGFSAGRLGRAAGRNHAGRPTGKQAAPARCATDWTNRTPDQRRPLAIRRDPRFWFLYARPGTEAFYRKLGFLPMTTAMAIWGDPSTAIASGLLRMTPAVSVRGAVRHMA
jgi:hypothetical protein